MLKKTGFIAIIMFSLTFFSLWTGAVLAQEPQNPDYVLTTGPFSIAAEYFDGWKSQRTKQKRQYLGLPERQKDIFRDKKRTATIYISLLDNAQNKPLDSIFVSDAYDKQCNVAADPQPITLNGLQGYKSVYDYSGCSSKVYAKKIEACVQAQGQVLFFQAMATNRFDKNSLSIFDEMVNSIKLEKEKTYHGKIKHSVSK